LYTLNVVNDRGKTVIRARIIAPAPQQFTALSNALGIRPVALRRAAVDTCTVGFHELAHTALREVH